MTTLTAPAKYRLASGFAIALLPLAIAMAIQGPKPTQAKPASQAADFRADVLSVLKGQCVSCHAGPSPSGGLNLESYAGLMKGGDSGRVVVPRSAGKSLLIKRLRGEGGLEPMPLGFQSIGAEKIDRIRRWIDAGALAPKGPPPLHWAYVAPKPRELPAVKNQAWVRNPIDRFVLARLEAAGLMPSAEAQREQLIRRVSLDLIGMPPTPNEVRAFLSDKRPDAYERLVDRLLSSPHYGERMARPWLDLARYADTNGYESDTSRTAYLYRDWIIRAFNQNMPYDQFTVEQIAGDLLPNPTTDQLVATGFHRNSMLNLEGGVDQEEARYEVLLDRTITTASVWLGQTFSCARCHDHKYDPISQRDFFRMMAYFNNNAFDRIGNEEVGAMRYIEPSIQVPTAMYEEERARREAAVREAGSKLSAAAATLKDEMRAWIARVSGPNTWRSPSNAKAIARTGRQLAAPGEGTWQGQGEAPERDEYRISWQAEAGPLTAIRLDALPDERYPNGGPGESSGGNFILSRLTLLVNEKPVPLAPAKVDFIQGGYDVAGLADENGDSGWAVYPQPGRSHALVAAPATPLTLANGDRIEVRLSFDSPSWPQHIIGRFRVSWSSSAVPEVALTDADLKLLRNNDRSSVEESRVNELFATHSLALQSLRAEHQASIAARDAWAAAIPTALVMRDRPIRGLMTARLHERGEFLRPSRVVYAGTPAVLPSEPKLPSNRLGLARWLADRKNPLTARVEVNRLWELVFGRGIVETSENFGTQGSKPSHPELLDWLALEFMRSSWDIKAMLRMIVTSATYRQTSSATATGMAKDPENRLLSRAPRYRMEAEMLRDTMLHASGLLDLTVGGPSVFPPQPDGIWNSPYSGETWNTSSGRDRYRRGIYTFWKRTAPYPSFDTFDAGSRETCVIRRTRTNTPLQSLTLMNDPVYFEAAKALAARAWKDAGGNIADAVREAFVAATSRRPKQAELDRLTKLFRTSLDRYKSDLVAAQKLAASPELAALSIVTNVILNLDETICKG